jgi:hypothetical protein
MVAPKGLSKKSISGPIHFRGRPFRSALSASHKVTCIDSFPSTAEGLDAYGAHLILSRKLPISMTSLFLKKPWVVLFYTILYLI